MSMDQHTLDLIRRRDLVNFVNIRDAFPSEDLIVGELLVRSFRETYAKKLPAVSATLEREIELRDVFSRRRNGIVRVLELGLQVIGTYSLILPGQAMDESWVKGCATLRCVAIAPDFHSLKLSEYLLRDALQIARLLNNSGICLHVQKGADGVARLYEQVGFHRDSQGDRLCFGNEILGYHLDFKRLAREA